MDYDKKEYQQCLKYIQSTWSSLFDDDWLEKPKIKDIIISLFKGEFTVCVSLEPNSYYRFKDDKLITEEYKSDEYIKTTYTLNEDIILYMLINRNIINDLGLKDVQIFINPVYIDHIPINEYLSKELESFEESYAEDWYCFIHDL